MASKEVTDRSRSTTAAATMLESYAEQVTEGAQAALSAFAKDGEAVPDLGLVSTLLARMIEARRDELEAADADNERELSDDAKPRRERDRYQQASFDLIVTIRDATGANYGDTGLAALGLSEPCPSTTLGIARYGRALVKALRDDSVVLPEPHSKSIQLDRAALADELEAQVGPLEDAVKAVAREASEAKGTLARKDEAMQVNDHAFSVATGLGRQIFRLCGLTDLADRIRESPRGRGQLADAPPAPAPAGDASAPS